MSNSPNVLVTGVKGFVGRTLRGRVASFPKFEVAGAVRSGAQAGDFDVGNLNDQTNWQQPLEGRDVVIHTAARAHIMKDEVPDPLAEYRKVNVDGTLNLARQAAEVGVRRFVFISSIKVNGEQTLLNQPFTAKDTPAPEDAYGISKMEAEQGLQALAAETGMEVVLSLIHI